MASKKKNGKQEETTRKVSLGRVQAEQSAPDERVVVVKHGSGEVQAQKVPEALRSVAEGTGRIAGKDELTALAQGMEAGDMERQAGSAFSTGLGDSAKAYALNAWDEFTFGASTALLRGAARVRGDEAEFLEWARGLRESNPIAYHLGGFAGGVGQLVATEGTLSALKAQKVLQAERLAEMAKVAAEAGDAAKAAELLQGAREARTAAAGAEAAEGLRGEKAAEEARVGEAYGMPANDNAGLPFDTTAPANDNAFNPANPNALGGPYRGSVFNLDPAMPRNQVPALFQAPAREAVADGAAQITELENSRLALQEPESLRSIRSGELLAAEEQEAATGVLDKIESAAEKAVPKGLPENLRGTKAAPILEGLSKTAAQGALSGIGYDISSTAMGDKPFSAEDMFASGVAGAAIGGLTHVGATLASRGVAKAAGAFADKEANRIVAQALRDAGLTDNQFKRLVMQFSGAADGQKLGLSEVESAVQNIRKTVEGGGVDLVKTSKADLYKEIAKAKESVGDARSKLFSYANEQGVGARVQEARMIRNLSQLVNSAETSSTTGAYKKASGLLERFQEDMSNLGEMDVEKKLARMDKLQSEMGQAERDTLKLNGEQTFDSKLFGAVRNIIRDEMSQAFHDTGNKGLIEAYKANNKAYAALSMMDRYLSAKSMGADLNKFAGLMPVDTSGPGRLLGRAAVSTAFFGKPYSVLYDAAGGSLLRGMGRGVNAIRRGVAGMATSLAAREGAQKAFPRALQAMAKVGGKVGARTLEPSLEAVHTQADFDALMNRVDGGIVSQELRDQLSELSPKYVDEVDAWNQKLVENVNAMLPPKTAFAIGEWTGTAAAKAKKKKSALNTDQLKVLRYLDAVANPLAVPKKVVAGVAGPEHTKAVKDMYPAMFDNMVDGLMSSLVNGSFDDMLQLSPETRMALSNFLGQPLSATDTDTFIAMVAKARMVGEEGRAKAEQSKGGGGSTDTKPNGHDTQTESERISS